MRDLFSVGSKLLGLYVIVQIVQMLGSIPATLFVWDNVVFSVGVIVQLLVYAALAVVLIGRADRIAAALCPETGEDANAEGEEGAGLAKSLNRADIERIAFAAVGVYILANALAFLPGDLTVILGPRQFAGITPHTRWGQGLSLVLKLAVGLYLLLGAQGLRNSIHRLRTAG